MTGPRETAACPSCGQPWHPCPAHAISPRGHAAAARCDGWIHDGGGHDCPGKGGA